MTKKVNNSDPYIKEIARRCDTLERPRLLIETSVPTKGCYWTVVTDFDTGRIFVTMNDDFQDFGLEISNTEKSDFI